MIHYDHRLESEKLTKIDWLSMRTSIVPVDSSRVIFYEKHKNMAVLTCAVSQKAKTLNFTHPYGIGEIKVIGKHGMAIAIIYSLNVIEIYDIANNKSIDKVILIDSSFPEVIVDDVDHSGKFMTYYTKSTGVGGNRNIILTLWTILPDRTVRNSEEIELPSSAEAIGFLNKDYIVTVNANHLLDLYRLDEQGIIKIHQTTVSLDTGYAPMAKPLKVGVKYKYSCLKVLDEKTFVVVRAREDDVSADKQKVILFNYLFDSGLQDEYEKSEFVEPKDIQYITSKVLIDHYPDKVIGITHWEDQFVVFLTRSKKLYHYNLQTGKLNVILTLQAIDPDEDEVPFIGMETLNREYVALHFSQHRGFDRILVFNIKEKIPYYDLNRWFSVEGQLKCALSFGKIFLMYAKSSDDIRTLHFGEFDYTEKKVEKISDYPGRQLLSNLTVTPRLIAIGTASIIDGEHEGTEKIIFYSLNEKKTLYEMNLSDLSPVTDTPNIMKKIMCVNDNLVAFFFIVHDETGDNNSFIILWDIDKRSVIAEHDNWNVRRLLGIHNKMLFYTATFNSDVTCYLDCSSYFGRYDLKNEPDSIDKVHFGKYDPVFKCIDTLAPRLPIFVAYDKKMYPNSLLFIRQKNPKVECLKCVDRKLSKIYNPYITKQVMDMIFKPKEKKGNISEQGNADTEIGEA